MTRPGGGYRPRHRGRTGAGGTGRTVWLVSAAVAVTTVGLLGAQALPSPGSGSHDRLARQVHSKLQGRKARFKVASAPATTQPLGYQPAAVALGFSTSSLSPWMQAENAKPGTTDWKLTKPARSQQIEGYANVVSVQAGDPVELYISTAAPTFSVKAFRMGYYGGDQGRLVWSAASEPGYVQARCPVLARTRTVECDWQHSVQVDTTSWPQGEYLFKLESSTGWQSYIPLTVRDDMRRSAYLVNNSVTTWQAYNEFGGRDLYTGPSTNGRPAGIQSRSQVVSFDRPYALGDGSGDFVALELPMVSMMESLGLDVSYTTDVDVSEQPQLLYLHRAFISLGHDEYFTLAMRQGLTQARDAGVNLVFLGANAAYRHIRLQTSPLGPDRREVDYKDPNTDPLLAKDNADVTPWAWRDAPNNAPESELLGEMWQCNPVRADMVVTDPGAWLYAGTGLRMGSRLGGIVGPEYDNFDPYAPNPGDVTVVARSPVRCDGHAEEADMTYYSSASGAGVWDTGTIDWVGSVGSYCNGCISANPVTRVTANVLAAFGAGPAGMLHPSQANVTRSSRGVSPTTLAANRQTS